MSQYNNLTTLFACFLLTSCISVSQPTTKVDYEQVASNVPYSKVRALSFRKPDKQIFYGTDSLQYGHLWKATPTGNRPLVVFIHGGCWLNAFDMGHTYAFSTALSQQGYDVWSLEYRRSGDVGGGWPGTFNDIMAGIQYYKNLPLDAVEDRGILMIGHSAGGHLALLAASQLNGKASNLTATVGLAAISDLATYSKGSNSCQSATSQFMGGPYDLLPDDYQQATIVNKSLPNNIILMQGKKDKIVGVEQSQLTDAEAILLDEAGHFDWIHPGSAAFKKLMEVIERF